MDTISNQSTSILWLIVLIPIFISICLYFFVKFLLSRPSSTEDEEIGTNLRNSDADITHPPSLQTSMSGLPPPSYFASHRDRLFRVHQSPEYDKPPEYALFVDHDPEHITLDKVKETVIEQRRRQREQH